MKKFLFLVFSLAVLQPVNALAQRTDRVINGNLGRDIGDVMMRLTHAGYSGSILVAKGGDIILEKGYSLADRARNIRHFRHSYLND